VPAGLFILFLGDSAPVRSGRLVWGKGVAGAAGGAAHGKAGLQGVAMLGNPGRTGEGKGLAQGTWRRGSGRAWAGASRRRRLCAARARRCSGGGAGGRDGCRQELGRQGLCGNTEAHGRAAQQGHAGGDHSDGSRICSWMRRRRESRGTRKS
jgi:hypothetical protein